MGGIGVFLWDTNSAINAQVLGLLDGGSGEGNMTFAQSVNDTNGGQDWAHAGDSSLTQASY